MKKIIFASVIILGIVFLCNEKSKVAYVDFDCPVCGCDEVLDYGTDHNGVQSCHCYECGANFTIE